MGKLAAMIAVDNTPAKRTLPASSGRALANMAGAHSATGRYRNLSPGISLHGARPT